MVVGAGVVVVGAGVVVVGAGVVVVVVVGGGGGVAALISASIHDSIGRIAVKKSAVPVLQFVGPTLVMPISIRTPCESSASSRKLSRPVRRFVVVFSERRPPSRRPVY